MRSVNTCLFLFCLAFLPFTIQAASNCSAFPHFRPSQGPLAVLNCDFHTQYEKRIDQIIKTFGAAGGRPIILNLGGTLLFKYNGKTETIDINPENYHYIKIFGHTVFSVYLALSKEVPGHLSNETRATLNELKNHLTQAALIIPSLKQSQDDKKLSRHLANLTESFIKKILNKNSYSKQDLNQYLEKARPSILQIINNAANIELHALDKTVNLWLAKLTQAERKKLTIVVATSHQARAEEISLQYFAKKFGYQYGEGALNEKKIIVLEDKFDEPSALKLLARHYLDRESAKSIFNNPERLQKDLLADSANEILQHL